MRLQILRSSLGAVFVLLAGCAGHSSAIPGAVTSSANSNPSAVQAAALVQMRAGNTVRVSLPMVSLPQGIRPPNFNAALGSKPNSSVGPSDNEVTGFVVSGGGPYTGMFSYHSAYRLSDFTTADTSGTAGLASLSAPVNLPPNGSCLASGSFYASSGASRVNNFGVINFCAPQPTFVLVTPIDANFESAFVRPSPHNIPSYITLNFTTDPNPSASSVWHSWLYNYTSAAWQEVATVTGRSNATVGVNAMSASLAQGACPPVPALVGDNIALFNASSPSFESLKPVMSAGTTSSFVPPSGTPTCFTDDGTATPFYYAAESPNNVWAVSSGKVSASQTFTVNPAGNVVTLPSVGGYSGTLTLAPNNAPPSTQWNQTISLVVPTGMIPAPTTPGGTGFLWVILTVNQRLTFSNGSNLSLTVPFLTSSHSSYMKQDFDITTQSQVGEDALTVTGPHTLSLAIGTSGPIAGDTQIIQFVYF